MCINIEKEQALVTIYITDYGTESKCNGRAGVSAASLRASVMAAGSQKAMEKISSGSGHDVFWTWELSSKSMSSHF